MILFECKTYFHLINAINICINNSYTDVDLILTTDTDFSIYIDAIIKTGIFNNIFSLKFGGSTYGRKYDTLSYDEQVCYFKHPKKFIETIELNDYSDYYLGLDDSYSKLFYYYMIKELNHSINVHLYEEGSGSYSMDFRDRLTRDKMDHEFYGVYNFSKNIVELLLYIPEWYGCRNQMFDINPIPKINISDTTAHALRSIFGTLSLPKQKYIYLEGGTFYDGNYSQDFDLINHAATIVGKDNILIKLHSRSNYDRFSKLGYNVFQTHIPFEVISLENDMSDRVLLSNISTATLTTFSVFEQKACHILLNKLLPHDNSLFIRSKGFQNSYNKIIESMNESGCNVFQPKNFEQLEKIMMVCSLEM